MPVADCWLAGSFVVAYLQRQRVAQRTIAAEALRGCDAFPESDDNRNRNLDFDLQLVAQGTVGHLVKGRVLFVKVVVT